MLIQLNMLIQKTLHSEFQKFTVRKHRNKHYYTYKAYETSNETSNTKINHVLGGGTSTSELHCLLRQIYRVKDK